MSSTFKYNDTRFFLIAIALISAFNYYLTYTNIRFNGFLILTYSLDTIEGWLAWWAVRSIILYLDRKMPYGLHPLRRIIWQVMVTTAVGLGILIGLTELVSWIARGRPALMNFYSFDIFIFIIWFLVINGIYIGLHYYREWKDSERRRMAEKEIRSGGFLVRQGKQEILVNLDDIISFYSDAGYIYLLTRQEKKYLIDLSLDKTERILPPELFFRINRQFLLNRSSIRGFSKLEDGKLEVSLVPNPGLPAAIPMSRIRAAAFKKWFRPGET